MDDETRPHIAAIPEESIWLISTISSLEQLCLTAGMSGSRRRQWLIHHPTLRAHLPRLERLKRLASCRDTYRPDVDDLEPEEYYDQRGVGYDFNLLAQDRLALDVHLGTFGGPEDELLALLREYHHAHETQEDESSRVEQVTSDLYGMLFDEGKSIYITICAVCLKRRRCRFVTAWV